MKIKRYSRFLKPKNCFILTVSSLFLEQKPESSFNKETTNKNNQFKKRNGFDISFSLDQ